MLKRLIKSFSELRRKKSKVISYSGVTKGQKTQSVAAKARDVDFNGRFREIIADPVNMLIDRHPLAGCVDDGKVILHNGLKVPASGPFAYYGDFSKILVTNRGVHEPLEEFCFQEVLKAISVPPTMLELGAYWGHYSMWCQSKIPKAKLFLVEPEKNHLKIAQKNFAENELFATFICDFVGKGHFTVDQFMENQKLTKLNILHSDIQGFEVEMLQDAKHSLSSHMIDYCFVSTHNEVLHLACVKTLEEYGYCVTVSAGFDTETTSCDGFILASSPRVKTVLENFWFFTREQCGSVSLTEFKKFLSQFEH